MFEFLEGVANNIITEISGSISQMEADATSYDAQAKENDARAQQCETDANAEEASCPHYKTETYTDTDDEGNEVEKTRSVPDTEADSRALANAAKLRMEAANLKTMASALRALAVALRLTSSALKSQQQKFNQAITNTQIAITFTTKLLSEGENMARQAIEAFNVPETKFTKEWATSVSNNLLKIIGVDLSDGLNDEIYNAIGVTTQLGTFAGTIAVRYTTSLINSKLGNGIIANVAKYEIKTASEVIIETYLGKTGAKVAQNAIASALTLHGINALPTERPETAKEQTEIKKEIKDNAKIEESKTTGNVTQTKVNNVNNAQLNNQSTKETQKTTAQIGKNTTINTSTKSGKNTSTTSAKVEENNNNNSKTTSKSNNVSPEELRQAQIDYAEYHASINNENDKIDRYQKTIKANDEKINSKIDLYYSKDTSESEKVRLGQEIERLTNASRSLQKSIETSKVNISNLEKKEAAARKIIDDSKKK